MKKLIIGSEEEKKLKVLKRKQKKVNNQRDVSKISGSESESSEEVSRRRQMGYKCFDFPQLHGHKVETAIRGFFSLVSLLCPGGSSSWFL